MADEELIRKIRELVGPVLVTSVALEIQKEKSYESITFEDVVRRAEEKIAETREIELLARTEKLRVSSNDARHCRAFFRSRLTRFVSHLSRLRRVKSTLPSASSKPTRQL